MYFYDFETELRLRCEEEWGKKKGALETSVHTFRAFFLNGVSAEGTAQFLGYSLELVKSAYSYFLSYPEWDSERITEDMMAKGAVRV